MIIPKAIFLQQTYRKNHDDLQRRLKNEYVLAISRIAGALHLPQNHKPGTLAVLLPTDEFPLLASSLSPDCLTEISNELQTAGYVVGMEKRNNGIVFTLDWTDSDLIRPRIPICSGQIWPSVGIRDPGSGICDRLVGIGDPVAGIPRFSLLKQWTTLSPDH